MATGVPRPCQQRGSRFAYRRAGDCGGCPANSGADHAASACGYRSAGSRGATSYGDRSTGAYRTASYGNRSSAYTDGDHSTTCHSDRRSSNAI